MVVMSTATKLVASGIGGAAFVAAAIPEMPGMDTVVEKGGVWILATVLVHWILNKLSRQLDGLTTAVNTLADKVGK